MVRSALGKIVAQVGSRPPTSTCRRKNSGQLILVQRGFQASAQIVNASNEMIQQLFDMRGNR